jgi:peptidoglycan/xylan/chitin deacetylase (PgdA/CDA1 family)
VRPAAGSLFQPLGSGDITPERLHALLRLLPRWGYDVVSMDDVVGRLTQPPSKMRQRRFVALTFDGWYRDVLIHAWPVLIGHRVPFTVYVATGFPDSLNDLWWLALERVVATQPRVGLAIDQSEQIFSTGTIEQKRELFAYLTRWMRTLSPDDLAGAIKDLCSRYSVDLSALSREACLNWDDIAKLSGDPYVTFGSATVSGHALSTLPKAQARREMLTGRDVLDAALGRKSRHFAYPFGDAQSVGKREIELAGEVGFMSAVTTEPRLLVAADAARLHALPRVTWDGRLSARGFRARLAGMGSGKVRDRR